VDATNKKLVPGQGTRDVLEGTARTSSLERNAYSEKLPGRFNLLDSALSTLP
jgi:hypothetical protein